MTAASRPRIAALAGTGGGFLSGIVGGGGGAVMIPLMTGPLKMRQHTAHGTSLLIIFTTALAAAITYSLSESIDAALLAVLIAASVVGAYVGARGARRIPGLRLRQLLGVFLIAVAARLLIFRDVDPVFSASGLAEAGIGAAIGIVGGIASGALGVGGGSIFVPALVLLLGVEQHEAQGLSLWVIVCSSAAGASTHYRQGTVDIAAARWIIPAAIPAAVLGALAATQLGASQLQTIFSIVLVGLGTQMVVTATRRLREGSPAVVLHPEADAI